MLSRLLLTCLALLTGLNAAGASADASLQCASRVEIGQSFGEVEAAELHAQRLAAETNRIGESLGETGLTAPECASSAAVRTVLVGIDRARE